MLWSDGLSKIPEVSELTFAITDGSGQRASVWHGGDKLGIETLSLVLLSFVLNLLSKVNIFLLGESLQIR